jgi:small redox-active disulfide protein 1
VISLVKLELFFSPVCPHCPKAKVLVKKIASRYDNIDYIEVNTYTEEGIKRGMSIQVMAVPAIAIDNEIKLVGWPFMESDLIKVIEESLR